MPINHLLVVYDLRAGKLVDFTEFGTDVHHALEAYGARARRNTVSAPTTEASRSYYSVPIRARRSSTRTSGTSRGSRPSLS